MWEPQLRYPSARFGHGSAYHPDPFGSPQLENSLALPPRFPAAGAGNAQPSGYVSWPLLWKRIGTKNFGCSASLSKTTSASASTIVTSRALPSANRFFRWRVIFLDSGEIPIRRIASASAWFGCSSKMSLYARPSRSRYAFVSAEVSTRRSVLHAR